MNSDHWFIIVNPKAGGNRLEGEWPKMARNLSLEGLEYTAVSTKFKGDAIDLVQTAIKNGHRKIAGVGGDGTNNEIINGILTQNLLPLDQISYALLPFGTGNDWSRTHRIPRKVSPWVKMIKANHQIQHKIGLLELSKEKVITRRFFINIAGMAYDAHIVKMGEEYPFGSRRKFLYLWLVFRWLWSYRSPRLHVTAKEAVRTEKYYTINCGICNYAGGGMKIVPHANPTSHCFGVTLIRDFPKWRVPFDTPKLFTGKLKGHRFTEMLLTDKILVTAAENNILEVETDGEYIGEGRVEITMHDQTINVVVPIIK